MKLALILILALFGGCGSNHRDFLYEKKPAFYTYIIGGVDSYNSTIEQDAEVYIAPASCQKTITALLAYKTLGSDYCYETKLLKDNKNVIIEFCGDPTLSSDDLVKLLEPLKGKHIQGKIILDASAFKTPAQSPNRMIDDIGTKYAQPVSSMNLDQNLITVKVTPSILYKPAIIQNDAGYLVETDITTTLEKSSIKITCDGYKLITTGTINVADKTLEFKISPQIIDIYILNKIKQIIKINKTTGDIIIQNDRKYSNVELISTHKSKNLGDVIPQALAKSDNLVFDSLYLTITNRQYPIKKWEEGDKFFKSLIKQYFNISMDKALFVDGSGLSRYNRIQPRQLYDLLKCGHEEKEFVNALPMPGQKNSSLEKRKNLPSCVRAKTGIMSGICGLCGYKGSQVFVIFANSFAPTVSETNAVLDEFIAFLLSCRED